MESLHSIAKTYYHASSAETRKEVNEFINSLDRDGDGLVDCYEFKQSLKEQGYKEYADSKMFKLLDRNRDNQLDRWEVMTLYYIILSGRPFCSGCDVLITAEYFVCPECFDNSSAPLYLCFACFKENKYKHSHRNRNALFLDTYALLESKRKSGLAKKEASSSTVKVTAGSTALVVSRGRRPSSTARIALRVFDIAIAAAISSCTIM